MEKAKAGKMRRLSEKFQIIIFFFPYGVVCHSAEDTECITRQFVVARSSVRRVLGSGDKNTLVFVGIRYQIGDPSPLPWNSPRFSILVPIVLKGCTEPLVSISTTFVIFVSPDTKFCDDIYIDEVHSNSWPK